jgi:hypothetical protein
MTIIGTLMTKIVNFSYRKNGKDRQDLLGHYQIRMTQRYSKVSNLKVQRDYHKAIGRVMSRHALKKGLDSDKKTLLN